MIVCNDAANYEVRFESPLAQGVSMFRIHRLVFAAVFALAIIATAPGCSLFEHRTEKTGPKTVEQWMAQDRVRP
jgi:hypothetical protein